MKLSKFYDEVIKCGMEADPRGAKEVKNDLERRKRQFEKLSSAQKKYFDKEYLNNPYDDTMILYGSHDTEIKKILAGIDIEVSEMLLADKLREKGKKIDLVLSHHPSGKALANLYKVMRIQVDVVANLGVGLNLAEGLLEPRIEEVQRRFLPLNHERAQSAAKLLDIPLMCAHTPADNHVVHYLTELIGEKKPDLVEDIIDILLEIPEYQHAAFLNAGPKVIFGKPSRRSGRIFVDMTGGTEMAKELFVKIAENGIGTVVCMHLSEDHLKSLREVPMNVIVAGHIASDTIGLNLLLDKITKKEDLEVIGCSGFTRVKR
ncbi:MAG: NGG1p interacting factor NIF3 [Candidatus Omnitrophota bacterium]